MLQHLVMEVELSGLAGRLKSFRAPEALPPGLSRFGASAAEDAERPRTERGGGVRDDCSEAPGAGCRCHPDEAGALSGKLAQDRPVRCRSRGSRGSCRDMEPLSLPPLARRYRIQG